MQRRTGTTLVEVLVAIFVMGIGLLAVLTLFPLGALNMAQAIRDARSTQSAINAKAFAKAFDYRNDPAVVALYSNPGGNLQNLAANPSYAGPSYPVYLDPFGYQSSFAPAQTWVGGSNALTYGIPRTTQAGLTNLSTMQRFVFLDDITFTDDGQPDTSTGFVERAGGFSWAYLFRRPSLASSSQVDVSIVVYNQRSLRLTQGLNPKEVLFNSCQFYTMQGNNPNTNNTVPPSVVVISWNTGAGQTAPDIRAGGWILDATIETDVNGNVTRPHGFFYRVREVLDSETTNTSMALLVDGTFKGFTKSANPSPGTIIIMDGVAEVFETG
jgi:type II secretory pathway pseudopilin PulG